MAKKLKIGILMGGKSAEREVSLNSGRTICDHLDTTRYDIIPLFQNTSGAVYILPWHFLHRGKTTDFAHRLPTEAQRVGWSQLKQLVDFMFIAQHGRYAEDGCLQGALETLGIPYYGSKILASALGMNKVMQRPFLHAAGINTPQHVVIRGHEINSDWTLKRVPDFASGLLLSSEAYRRATTDRQDDTKNIPLPWVVKPAGEGSSIGVSVVEHERDLQAALERAATASVFQDIIIEEYITGMEFSCIVLEDPEYGWRALPPTEISLEAGSRFFDYDQKYMPGRAVKHTPARCSKEERARIQEVAIATAQALEFSTIGRIDGFLTPEGKIIITDPNSFAGLDPASFVFLQAAEVNMSHTQFINTVLASELKRAGLEIGVETAMYSTGTGRAMRVAVLLGGRSNEREISLASGRNIVYKLSPERYEVLPIFVSSKLELYPITQRLLVRNTTAEIEEELANATPLTWDTLPEMVDFVFLGLHGGEGENGTIQGMLEMLGLPYNGPSVLASALCMNKYKTALVLKERGIAVPESTLIARDSWEMGKRPRIAYPAVVKPPDDGCSVMVHKVTNDAEFVAAVDTIFSRGKTHALVEEFLVGVELTVGVIGNKEPKALPPSMTVAQAGILSIQEKFLPGAGENQTPAPLPHEAIALVQKTAERAYTATDCSGYSRIDCFYQSAQMSPTGTERVVILEINTLPALTPATCLFHQAAEVGIRPMEFIDLIVQFGLEKHAPQRVQQFSLHAPIFC